MLQWIMFSMGYNDRISVVWCGICNFDKCPLLYHSWHSWIRTKETLKETYSIAEMFLEVVGKQRILVVHEKNIQKVHTERNLSNIM